MHVALSHGNRRLSPEKFVYMASSHRKSILEHRPSSVMEAMATHVLAFLPKIRSLQAKEWSAELTARQGIDKFEMLPWSPPKAT